MFRMFIVLVLVKLFSTSAIADSFSGKEPVFAFREVALSLKYLSGLL